MRIAIAIGALVVGTSAVTERLLFPNGPERISAGGNVVHVRTYDHVVPSPPAGRVMLEVGDRVPLDAAVWLAPNERHTFGEIVADGPVLVLFYLFDWTAT